MATLEEIAKLTKKVQPDLMKKMNVTGLGVGFKETKGKMTKELSLVVLVRKKVALSQLTSKDVIPAKIQDIVTDVKEVGDIVIHKSRTDRWRPAQPGISIGHVNITAGTFGAVVRDASTNRSLILSNNHVLANSNDARIGDTILQPGAADGGKAPQDRIADLERFVTINFEGGGGDGGDGICSIAKGVAGLANCIARILGSKARLIPIRFQAPNEVDAAVAKPVTDDVIKDEIVDIGLVTGVRDPELNLRVKKSGRTTAVTEGTITTLNATVEVGYGDGKTALFENQILTTNMSQPGDSGSLLLEAATNKAVGLLFAGSDQVTVYSPIKRVLELLNVKFA
ncbi:MAG: S1 family peptidase [candidate division KSB1 bacterium]|nr:S1 family peptidase [candidate division KSB1 bacterium]